MPVPPGNQICICTIEKANAIVNQLIEEGRLDEVGCVVVDEVRKYMNIQVNYVIANRASRYD
jgi:thymidine kinase